MKHSIVLSKSQENELQQLFNELTFSLKKTFSEEDLLEFAYTIFKESGKQTYNSKKDTAQNLANSIWSFSKKAVSVTIKKVDDCKNEGLINTLNKDYNYFVHQVKKSPDNFKNLGSTLKNKAIDLNEQFLKKTKEEKIELLAVGIMGLLIFYASAGGTDLEGGLPDSDLNAGIGFHRHFISHSIIMGFIIEFLMRAGLEIINKSYKNLPINHHAFWDKTNQFLNKNRGVAIGAMWAGIGAHLIKDSGIFGHGVKPYSGLPIELSMDAHENLFAVNGVAASLISYSELKK